MGVVKPPKRRCGTCGWWDSLSDPDDLAKTGWCLRQREVQGEVTGMSSADARDCVTSVRRLLRAAMRDLSVPRPDWGCAAATLDWAATLCMELARDCRREGGGDLDSAD